MGINTISTTISQVEQTDRFEPKYHVLYKKLEEYERNSSFNIVVLGYPNLLNRITDGEHAGQVFVDKGVRFIKNSAVRDFNIDLLDDFYISNNKHKQQSRSALKAEDILFTTIGHLGSAAIIPIGFGEANINQNVVKLEINKDYLNPYYLTAYLNSNATKKQIHALSTGNIQSILTYPKIKNIRVIIPNEEFQTDIANLYRDAIDKQKESMEFIRKAQEIFYKSLKINFDAFRKVNEYSANMSILFNSDLWTPKSNYPLYLDVINEIKKRFNTCTLDSIATIFKGDEVGSINYNEYLEKKQSDVPFIRTSDIVNYEVDLFPDNFIPKEIYNDLRQHIKPGDVIFSNDGKIGLTAMLTSEDRVILQSHIRVIRLNDEAICKYKLTQEYLFLLLTIKEIAKYQSDMFTVVQSTIPTLSNRLNNFVLPILDEAVIQDITDLIKIAFELKTKKKQIITEIREKIDKTFKL